MVTSAPTGYAQVFLRSVGWADRWTHALPPVVECRDAKMAFATLKAVYGRRSDLVHGTGKENKAIFDLGSKKIPHVCGRGLPPALAAHVRPRLEHPGS